MSLRIVNLQAENYKRLVAVDITPDGDVVTITGRNGQGKTSVLDAIWAALAGGDASRATSQPIRDGETKAEVRLDLGDYIVTRRWTKDDAGTLTVEAPDTARYSSPQKLLDRLVGNLTFDPLAFVGMKPADQIDMLISALGDSLNGDPHAIDGERADVYAMRTNVNRTIKQLEGRLAALPLVADDTPDEEVSAADLFLEAERIREHNADLNEALEEMNREGDNANRAEQVWRDAVAEAERLRVEYEEQQRIFEARRDEFRAAPALLELEPVLDRIRNVEAINAAVRDARARGEVERDLSIARVDAAKLTQRLGELGDQKAQMLARASFPVSGLSFTDVAVTLDGVPIGQASTAEQIRVSVALAMSLNPTLRVLRVDRAESLDADSLAIIERLAAEHDYQIWLSRVDESGVGVVIEDGQVRA